MTLKLEITSRTLTWTIISIQMAAITSNAACAPITSHNTTSGSLPELTRDTVSSGGHEAPAAANSCTNSRKESSVAGAQEGQLSGKTSTGTSGTGGVGGTLVDKLHGLTEKLSALTHHRTTDPESSSRSRAGTCKSAFF